MRTYSIWVVGLCMAAGRNTEDIEIKVLAHSAASARKEARRRHIARFGKIVSARKYIP